MDATFAAVSFFIGVLTGLTGVGGGALLTPVLILLGIPPLAAVSSDLAASLLIRPFGAVVHGRQRTVDLRLVLWLCAGSVPAGFSGALLLTRVPDADQVNELIRALVGLTMALTVVLMAARMVVSRRPRAEDGEPLRIHAARTVALGAGAGLLVGLTSIGSGSIVIAGLLLLYPRLPTARLVGTDIAHAIPLVAAATAGHLLFGQVHLALAFALVVGGVPGVILGSLLANRVPGTVLRAGLIVLLAATAATLLATAVQAGR